MFQTVRSCNCSSIITEVVVTVVLVVLLVVVLVEEESCLFAACLCYTFFSNFELSLVFTHERIYHRLYL